MKEEDYKYWTFDDAIFALIEKETQLQAKEKEINELRVEVVQWNQLALNGTPFEVDNQGCQNRIGELVTLLKRASNTK